jgi:hypothetical protein
MIQIRHIKTHKFPGLTPIDLDFIYQQLWTCIHFTMFYFLISFVIICKAMGP